MKGFFIFSCFLSALNAVGVTGTTHDIKQVTFDQRIGSYLRTDLEFNDETANKVKLATYFSEKPIVLYLGYYHCPMLCDITMDGIVESLNDLKLTVGKDFDLISISIDPHDSPATAFERKAKYTKRYRTRNSENGWHFLTGNEHEIKTLTQSAGFNYFYDNESKEYAHPSGLIVISSEGVISQYLFGLQFQPRELAQALKLASNHQTGQWISKLAFVCFHYNPLHGKYANLIMLMLRVSCLITVLCLTSFFIYQFKYKTF
jgi:protein SCO1/2